MTQIAQTNVAPVSVAEVFASYAGSLVRDTEARRTLLIEIDPTKTAKFGKERVPTVVLRDAQRDDVAPIKMTADKANELFAYRRVDTLKLLTGKAAENAQARLDQGPSKKLQALMIYKEEIALGNGRKEVMDRMQAELGMSEKGANTYYQQMKTGVWA